MPKVKRQHYVPQFYLKKFAQEDGKLWIFDKSTKESFKSNVKNVACETGFYDIPKNIASKDVDTQIVEKMLSNIEHDFSKAIGDILTSVDEKQNIDPSQKQDMAFFVTIQLLRTREHRTGYVQLAEKAAKAILDRITKVEMPDVSPSDYEVKFNQEMASLEQAKFMSNPEFLEKSVQILTNHIWFIGINDTNQPFYTSDSPVVRHAHKKIPFCGSSGIASEGIEIAFPLTPRHILILCERTYHRYFTQWDCKCMPLNAENLKYYNCMQVVQCNRYVYCPKKKFSFARHICNENPEYCKPDRPRITVH